LAPEINLVDIDTEFSEQGLSHLKYTLNILVSDERQYSMLFIQPNENIDVSHQWVRNENSESACSKYKDFLKLAQEKHADLVISPEYSCPWQVIEGLIQNEKLPSNGKLWVLGCESITPIELDEFSAKYQDIIWIYERDIQQADGNFLNPVCYIFKAKDREGIERTIIIVQFKCQPMADHIHQFERNNLIRGTKRYILRNNDESIHLITLICSDALGIEMDWCEKISMHKPYLIIHPQLNLKPRHSSFMSYRQLAFKYNREYQEFVCVNWARGFKLPDNSPSPFGGSAFYTKSTKLDLRDVRVNENHRKGLYYTKCATHRSHTYFFNYDEHLFFFRTTKPSQSSAPGVLQNTRTGPEMLDAYSWDDDQSLWIEGALPDDEFERLCEEVNTDVSPLSDETMTPLNKERLLALSNGEIASQKSEWFRADQLKFLEIHEDEIIRRMTMVQDPCDKAYEEKYQNLIKFSRLKNQILTDSANFPECIRDLSESCIIHYPIGENGYNFNLCSNSGHREATGVFLGVCSLKKLTRVYDNLASILQDHQRRLVVWYEDQNGDVQAKCREKPEIDDDLLEDRRSITKER